MTVQYNKLYFDMNNQNYDGQPGTPGTPSTEVDIDNTEDIDSYEKLFQDSYKEHLKSVKTSELLRNLQAEEDPENREVSTRHPVAEGRIFIGMAGVELVRSREEGIGRRESGGNMEGSSSSRSLLAVAEVAGLLGARKTGELVPEYWSGGGGGGVVEVRAWLEEESLEVRVRVQVTTPTTPPCSLQVCGEAGEDLTTPALTGCSLALVSVFQAVREVCPGCEVRGVRLLP